ncbi:hypothetical protein C8Q76DRAFT_711863 [Earliella scabrosa]|nr:hypothetical protein C8Q76DRAFT_711863 [Earliella scabrosa]
MGCVALLCGTNLFLLLLRNFGLDVCVFAVRCCALSFTGTDGVVTAGSRQFRSCPTNGSNLGQELQDGLNHPNITTRADQTFLYCNSSGRAAWVWDPAP